MNPLITIALISLAVGFAAYLTSQRQREAFFQTAAWTFIIILFLLGAAKGCSSGSDPDTAGDGIQRIE